MGEYWKPVNLTRGEFIHPHHVNCGLKLGEWWGWNDEPVQSEVRTLMAERWSLIDDVRALSDYGGDIQLTGVRGPKDSPDYENIEELFVEIGL